MERLERNARQTCKCKRNWGATGGALPWGGGHLAGWCWCVGVWGGGSGGGSSWWVVGFFDVQANLKFCGQEPHHCVSPRIDSAHCTTGALTNYARHSTERTNEIWVSNLDSGEGPSSATVTQLQPLPDFATRVRPATAQVSHTRDLVSPSRRTRHIPRTSGRSFGHQ
jgi:hypothetical protein